MALPYFKQWTILHCTISLQKNCNQFSTRCDDFLSSHCDLILTMLIRPISDHLKWPWRSVAAPNPVVLYELWEGWNLSTCKVKFTNLDITNPLHRKTWQQRLINQTETFRLHFMGVLWLASKAAHQSTVLHTQFTQVGNDHQQSRKQSCKKRYVTDI